MSAGNSRKRHWAQFAGDVIEAQQTASQLGIIPARESIQFNALIRIDVAQC
jgi:hypothetical protein